MSLAVLLNDTKFYSTKLQNVTSTNISERDFSLRKGNYSHKPYLNMSDEAIVYISNRTKNILEADDIHTDRTNDSIKHTLKDSDKFDMLGNENKSSNHLQRITSESVQISLTSLPPTDSVSENRTEALPDMNNETNHTFDEDVVTKTISNQNSSEINSSRDEIDKNNNKLINASTSNVEISDNLMSSTTMQIKRDQLSYGPKTQSKDQITIPNHVIITTSYVMDNRETTRHLDIKETVHHPSTRGKLPKHHKAMHHLSLVPIEDGPFGSLIWKDKKYLISVLIPIVIGIIGAACIIGMTYTARYCQKYEMKIREIRSSVTNQTPPNNDQIVLLADSSDEL